MDLSQDDVAVETAGTTRSERRQSRALLALAAGALLVAVAAILPSSYVIERPGPVVDVLGTVTIDDAETPVLTIDGAESYDTSGTLNLLTVSLVGNPDDPVSWLSLLPAALDRSQDIAPVEQFFPEGVSTKDRDEMNTAMMDDSQQQSAAAAFRELGEEVESYLVVASIVEGGPADGTLREGDRIVTAGGQPVYDYEGLRAIINDSGAGTPLVLTVQRDGTEESISLTPEVLAEGDEPRLGAGVKTEYVLPATVTIQLSDIGGPSAGMIFSLGIYDQLTDGALLKGMTVSGTGTITDQGEVGPIGGLPQKMWAASRAKSELFLMPIENCPDVPSSPPPGLKIAPIASLHEAIAAVETAASGGTPAGLERCDAQ